MRDWLFFPFQSRLSLDNKLVFLFFVSSPPRHLLRISTASRRTFLFFPDVGHQPFHTFSPLEYGQNRAACPSLPGRSFPLSSFVRFDRPQWQAFFLPRPCDIYIFPFFERDIRVPFPVPVFILIIQLRAFSFFFSSIMPLSAPLLRCCSIVVRSFFSFFGRTSGFFSFSLRPSMSLPRGTECPFPPFFPVPHRSDEDECRFLPSRESTRSTLFFFLIGGPTKVVALRQRFLDAKP